MTRLITGLACLVLPMFAQATGLPDFTVRYTVQRNDTIVGTRTLSFARQSQHYQFDSVLTAQGLVSLFGPNPVTEHSEGRIDNNQVLVDQYRRDDGNRPAKNMRLDVDNQQRVVHSHLPVKLSYGFTPVLRDPLNEILGFMYQADGPASMVYSIADDDGLDHYRLERIGQSTIRTEAGEFQAIQYRRTRSGKDDRYTLIWCAPALHYLPVRIERHKRGTVSVMSLTMQEGL